jgi:hypothetical protein
LTDQHPITPPPELVQQWWTDAQTLESDNSQEIRFIINVAARWGADQELEACCEWFVRDWTDIETADELRVARRPKPPSLKEQALALVNSNKPYLDDTAMDIIRKALEQLND